MVNVNAANLQGDAHLLRIGNTTVLIDAGYYSEAKSHLIPFLQKSNIQNIDYFFITHPHRDHYEGALAILESGISITHLFYKEPARDVEDCCYSRSHFVWFMGKMVAKNVRTFQPAKGYLLELPYGSILEILHAQEGNFPDKKVDVNDLSIVLRWTVNGRKVLFTGDLNTAVGTFLSSDIRMKADIIKIPHHGGRSLVPNSFYNRVDPDLVFVPGTKYIWCDERGAQTRKWVAENKVPTWVNGTDGHVSINFKGDKIAVSPRRPIRKCMSKDAPEPVYPDYFNER